MFVHADGAPSVQTATFIW